MICLIGSAPSTPHPALASAGAGFFERGELVPVKFRRAVHFFIVGTSSAAVGGVLFFFCRISRSYSSRFALSARWPAQHPRPVPRLAGEGR